MADATIGSILLASTHPEQLRDWYTAAFSPKVDRTPGEPGYDVLDFDGFYIMLDRRDDVGDTNPEPGRVLLNFEVADARAAAGRLDDLGATWLSPLEDRDGSWFGTAVDPDGNYVQIIQLSAQARAEMS
ncbi:Glyoxalase/bleomycin resistance protein/dioxygenase [Rhodococcus wratislaviensis]|uniref:Glyoxalase/bleomycin resistance protein/dioxygenase n=1 Tax=Rhodococcus wratislaviensis TaxID=44752 RepID=A0A402C0S9_RHOWR|nr:VOC family protein [Rhodococcus wratislaviensis]GCE37181.1 Glyoxalase/bleomycin resistance protein/dioxygenase [Rhodococcus wratislaviensis]